MTDFFFSEEEAVVAVKFEMGIQDNMRRCTLALAASFTAIQLLRLATHFEYTAFLLACEAAALAVYAMFIAQLNLKVKRQAHLLSKRALIYEQTESLLSLSDAEGIILSIKPEDIVMAESGKRIVRITAANKGSVCLPRRLIKEQLLDSLQERLAKNYKILIWA
ncbi:MAG: hypothetical protein RSE36_00640 [Oscillospiraceae bacterium]